MGGYGHLIWTYPAKNKKLFSPLYYYNYIIIVIVTQEVLSGAHLGHRIHRHHGSGPVGSR